MRLLDMEAIFSSDLSCIEKMVLLSIAKHANAPGDCPWPSLDTIAKLSSLNVTTAVRAIAKLKSKGWLLAKKRFGHSTMYTVQYVTASQSDGVTMCSAPVLAPVTLCSRHSQFVTPSQPVCDGVTTNHPSNHPIESSNTIPGKDAGHVFEAFWNHYGKKVGRQETLKAWARLTEAERYEALGATPDWVKAKPDPKYRKDPVRYLKGRHWEDMLATEDAEPPEGSPEWWNWHALRMKV